MTDGCFICRFLIDPFDEGAQEVPSYSCEVVATNSMMDSDFLESFDGKVYTLMVLKTWLHS